jgi:pimeloyl-ACP methyl ester carboxylesterase
MAKVQCHPDNNNLHYYVQGEGHPVVLIHGIAASNYDWIYLTPGLASLGYQVFAPDLIGHGNSAKPTNPSCYTFEVLYQHFIDWTDEIEPDQKVTLIGHSMGGLIALYYGIEYPSRVSRIVLIDPFYTRNQLNPVLRSINKRSDWYQKALEISPQWLIHAIISMDVNGLIHFEERTRQQIAEDYKRASPLVVHIPGSIPDVIEDIKKIQIPTLVVWGSNDATLNPRSFPQLVHTLPNGQGSSLEGAGHQPHLSQPKRFNQLVLDFLQE